MAGGERVCSTRVEQITHCKEEMRLKVVWMMLIRVCVVMWLDIDVLCSADVFASVVC